MQFKSRAHFYFTSLTALGVVMLATCTAFYSQPAKGKAPRMVIGGLSIYDANDPILFDPSRQRRLLEFLQGKLGNRKGILERILALQSPERDLIRRVAVGKFDQVYA